MIQRFTCVPAQEYEALVVTNGTVDQVEQSLDKISGQCQDFSKCTLIYFDTLNDLLVHLLQNESPAYHGKVLFMFFDGLNFVQKTLGDLIDHYNDRWHPRCVPYTYSMTLVVRAKTAKSAAPGAAAKTRGAAGGMERLDNAYFYLDRSVCDENACQDGLFLAIVAIAQDILKKSAHLIGRVRGLFIDDEHLGGERTYPLHSLVKNFPSVELVELTSAVRVSFNDMVY